MSIINLKNMLKTSSILNPILSNLKTKPFNKLLIINKITKYQDFYGHDQKGDYNPIANSSVDSHNMSPKNFRIFEKRM